jgi:hypothetical protein
LVERLPYKQEVARSSRAPPILRSPLPKRSLSMALDSDPIPAHTVRNVTVGGIRDARTAGIRPANAPIRMAEAMPPDHASTGITTAPALRACVHGRCRGPGQHADDAAMTASRIDSVRNCVRIWPFVAPRARRRPISERRSSTEMIMVWKLS